LPSATRKYIAEVEDKRIKNARRRVPVPAVEQT